MTNYLSMIALNVVMFFGLILSLPASAAAQQEVDPTYYEPVPAQSQKMEQAGKPAGRNEAKQAKKDQHAKLDKQAKNNAQTLIAKK